MGLTARADARHHQRPRSSSRNQCKKEEGEAIYQRSSNRSAIVTTPGGARATDHIGKVIISDTSVEIEIDYLKNVIQNFSLAEYGEGVEQSSEKRRDQGNKSIGDVCRGDKGRRFWKGGIALNDLRNWKKYRRIGKGLENIARQGNAKIVESLLKLTKIGDNKKIMRRVISGGSNGRKGEDSEIVVEIYRDSARFAFHRINLSRGSRERK